MNKPYHFGAVQPLRIFLSEDVRMRELVQALTGTHLTVSNRPDGIVIHRMSVTAANSAGPTIPYDVPPGPRAA